MSVPRAASSQIPEFRDTPPFPGSHYVPEYASYLDLLGSNDMHASDQALYVHDLHSVLLILTLGCESSVGCTAVDVACLCGIASVPKLIAIFPCSEKVEYEKDLSMFVRRFEGQPLPKLGSWLAVLPRPFR